jgi:hypothetical protein
VKPDKPLNRMAEDTHLLSEGIEAEVKQDLERPRGATETSVVKGLGSDLEAAARAI